jgi:hypothetical protein
VEFLWTAQREEAALLVAQDELTDEQIAKRVGVTRNGAVARWKATPAFRVRVNEHVREWAQRFREEGLCVKERRVRSLVDDFAATELILSERGEQLADFGGGCSTGFICRDYKGKDATQEVFFFDAALMRERRAIREQIAQELGDVVTKHEHTGKNGAPIDVTVNARELLTSRIASIAERRGTGRSDIQPDGRTGGEDSVRLAGDVRPAEPA